MNTDIDRMTLEASVLSIVIESVMFSVNMERELRQAMGSRTIAALVALTTLHSFTRRSLAFILDAMTPAEMESTMRMQAEVHAMVDALFDKGLVARRERQEVGGGIPRA